MPIFKQIEEGRCKGSLDMSDIADSFFDVTE
jgi:hypothetical protein